MTEQNLPQYKKFKEYTDDELRQRADDALRVAQSPHSAVIETAKLLQAQLYMTELDRRDNALIAERDYKMANRSHNMEWVVIILILIESLIGAGSLYYGIHEGNKQQTVLDQMTQNTGRTADNLKDQSGVLQTLQTNTHDTVVAVGNLQKVQGDSLEAQKNTLKSIGLMNTALQKQLDLAFDVSVHIVADDKERRLSIANLTRTSIYVWGAKFGDEPAFKFADERFLGPGGTYSFFFQNAYKLASQQVPAGGERRISFDLYIQNAVGKSYVARSFLREAWDKDEMRFYVTQISMKQENWPAGVQ